MHTKGTQYKLFCSLKFYPGYRVFHLCVQCTLGGQKLKNCVSYNMEGRKYQFLIKFRSFFAFILFNFIAWFSCLGCSNFYFRNLFFKPKIHHYNYWQIVVLKYTVPTSLEKIERFNLPSQKFHRQTVYSDKIWR